MPMVLNLVLNSIITQYPFRKSVKCGKVHRSKFGLYWYRRCKSSGRSRIWTAK